MKFPYSTIVSSAPGTSDFYLIRRPEIPITIIGPGGSTTVLGLVDTGSDSTIFPRSIADLLQISLEAAAGASVFGGQTVELFIGTARLQIETDGQPPIAWLTPVSFCDFSSSEDESVILGHSGFLDYFTATFDGELAELMLIANGSLPAC